MKRWRLSILVFCMILVLQGSWGIIAKPLQGETITRQAFIELMQGKKKLQGLEEDAKIRPQEKITREEVAQLIVKALGYKGIAKNYEKSELFTDVQHNRGAIHIVAELGIINGVGNRQFNPNGGVTHDQATTIINRIVTKLETPTKWLNGFYALSSSRQMASIKKLDAVSFGWAQVQYDEVLKEVKVNTSNTYGNEFSIPSGFEGPMDLATQHQVEKYLMVYLEDQIVYTDALGKKVMLSEKLLADEKMSEEVIDTLVSLCKSTTKEGITRSFEGITIDFENFYSDTIKEPYNQFLTRLKSELHKENKKLNVAVHPNTYYKGYDYKGIGAAADKVILMAHDYSPKALTEAEQARGIAVTPQTPIHQIYEALKAITDPETGITDKNKIVLQISFASTQWQVKDGKIINNKPYTPDYNKIYQRLLSESTEIFYDKTYQNPYAIYRQENTKNVIWYENEESVEAKINLAKLFDIYNISFWRLGTIPNFQDTDKKIVSLDILGNKEIFNH